MNELRVISEHQLENDYGPVTWYLVEFDRPARINQWGKEITSQYFRVSGTYALGKTWEVLVFPCDNEGNVSYWLEVAGKKLCSFEEAIEELRNLCNKDDDNEQK